MTWMTCWCRIVSEGAGSRERMDHLFSSGKVGSGRSRNIGFRVPWLRTNGVNTNGVTAKVLFLTDLKKVLKIHFGKWRISVDPTCPLLTAEGEVVVRPRGEHAAEGDLERSCCYYYY